MKKFIQWIKRLLGWKPKDEGGIMGDGTPPPPDNPPHKPKT